MPSANAAQGVPGYKCRVPPSRWKDRRTAKVQRAAGNVDLWQADRLRDPISDAEIRGVELGVRLVRAELPIDSESGFIDQVRAEGVDFIEGEKLPVSKVSVSEAGNGVAEVIRLDALRKIVALITVQPVAVCEDVIDVQPPLIVVDRPRRRTDKTRRSRGVDEIRARDECSQFRSCAVGDGRAIGVAEDQTVQTQFLQLTEAFI
jgi:hypothetical protein